MSEPVGNSPRQSPEVPSNSHKERAAKEPKKELESPEKAEKIVTGKVVTRKLPWYRRFMRGLIADDAQSIGDFILSDVVIPATKNLIAEIVGQGTNKVLFGAARNRRGLMGERPGLRTRYDLMHDRDEPRRMMSRDERARHDFDQVVLETRSEAIEVVEALIYRVDRFGATTVSDLYDLVGVTGSYADRSWGWTDLRTADVRQVHGGFLLDLPRPEPLNR